MDNIKEIISEQNGGSDKFYVCEEDNEEFVFPCQQNRRSYIFAKVTHDFYDNFDSFNCREQRFKGQVYKPGETIEFPNELLTTDDYAYPDKNLCVSSLFVNDVIDLELENEYYLFIVDLIWCRSDVLQEFLHSK